MTGRVFQLLLCHALLGSASSSDPCLDGMGVCEKATATVLLQRAFDVKTSKTQDLAASRRSSQFGTFADIKAKKEIGTFAARRRRRKASIAKKLKAAAAAAAAALLKAEKQKEEEASTMSATEAPTTPPTMPPSKCSQYTNATSCKIATCGWNEATAGPCVACESATTEADCETISYLAGCSWSTESTCKGALTIDFGGKTSGVGGARSKLQMRPEDTRVELCNGGSCGECTDEDKCWHGENWGHMVLNLPANSPGVRKWTVWTQCVSSDGELKFLLHSITNGIITVFMNGNLLYTLTTDDVTTDYSNSSTKKWKTTSPLPKDIKIVISFMPTDPAQASAASMKLRASNQDEFVDACLDRGFCLNEMAKDSNGFALRNSNRGQFDCLQGNTNLLPSGMVSQCAAWKQCLDSQATSSPEGAGFEASLVHMFGAAFVDDEADNTVTADESCIDPRIADAEVFECECLNGLKTQCASQSNQTACYKELFCGHCMICLSWKQEKCSATQVAQHQTSCSATPLLERSSSRSSAALLQRTIASASKTSLDSSLQDKCAAR